MKILALDTSTEHCSVALWMDGAIDGREVLAGQRHSQLVLGIVDELLRGRGLLARDLDGIAFGAGPGSFTGLRIACGIAQGIAFGADLPVVAVGTLIALAEAAQADRVVCCIDARMEQVYHAAYLRSGARWSAVHEPGLYAPAGTPALPEDAWTGCGSGFRTYHDELARHYAGRLSAIMPDLFPRARDIARLAVPEFEAGRAIRAEAATPLYVRDKVALRSDER